MDTNAVIMRAPRQIEVGTVGLIAPTADDIVVAVRHSGISTGTEKLFWSGDMPPFPGMGYPLIPGYEAAGEVVEVGANSDFRVGDNVFVPGATGYEGAHGLFGGASACLVSHSDRATRIDPAIGSSGALLALAATAYHAIHGPHATLPDLIVGHGVLGRLLARLTIIAGADAPTVWEIDPIRQGGADGYKVLHPEADPRRNYRTIYDVSGDASLLNDLIGRIAKGGEVVLAGFYAQPLQFAFPPAFMKEARLRVAAEWAPEDMIAVRGLVETGALRLDDLVTHTAAATDAPAAYETAFTDPHCLKMILDWSTL